MTPVQILQILFGERHGSAGPRNSALDALPQLVYLRVNSRHAVPGLGKAVCMLVHEILPHNLCMRVDACS